MNKLTIKRMDRLSALYLNILFGILSLGICSIFNFPFYANTGKTVGSTFLGFATLKEDGTPPGYDGALLYWLARMVIRFLYVITLGMLFIYEVKTLEKRNGNLAEAFTKQFKTQQFD